MKITGTEDLRVQKSIKAIKESFELLISKKDFERITVKELCETAMINKKTFYQYYEDLNALLAELQGEMLEEYLDRVKDLQFPDDLEKANREFFTYTNSKGKLVEKITCSGNFTSQRNSLIDNVMSSTWKKSPKFIALDKSHQEMLLHFINTSSIECYRQWVNSGKKIPLEEVILLTGAMISKGAKEYLKKASR